MQPHILIRKGNISHRCVQMWFFLVSHHPKCKSYILRFLMFLLNLIFQYLTLHSLFIFMFHINPIVLFGMSVAEWLMGNVEE